jgi:hypothetical protein
MIGRDVLLQAELVKQRLLQHRPLAHHQPAPKLENTESGLQTCSKTDFFNTIGR